MLLHRFYLHCQRIDDARNMARYYTLSIQPTLFGEVAVVRCWGRIGARGGEKSDLFASGDGLKPGWLANGDQTTSANTTVQLAGRCDIEGAGGRHQGDGFASKRISR